MTVRATLKGMIDQNGHQPIQIIITNNRKQFFRPTGIKILPSMFKGGRVSKEHPKSKEYNQILETRIIQLQAEFLEGLQKKKPRTPLLQYIEQSIKQLEGIGEPGTVGQYNSQLTKLKGYTSEIMLTSIDHAFLYGYQSYLKGLGNDGNTIWSSFKFLRKFINKAIREKLLSESPFKNFPFPIYVEKIKPYLLPEEVKSIHRFINKKGCPDNLVFAGTWFLIACSTGLRLADLKLFDKKKNIHGGRLIVQTDKTFEPVGMPIDSDLKALFERVNYKPLGMSGEAYNRLLKVIIAGAGVFKRVSSHTARHTAAMTMADKGIGRDVVAKVLGHRDLRSTATYYKVSNQRLDMELKKMKKK